MRLVQDFWTINKDADSITPTGGGILLPDLAK